MDRAQVAHVDSRSRRRVTSKKRLIRAKSDDTIHAPGAIHSPTHQWQHNTEHEMETRSSETHIEFAGISISVFRSSNFAERTHSPSWSFEFDESTRHVLWFAFLMLKDRSRVEGAFRKKNWPIWRAAQQSLCAVTLSVRPRMIKKKHPQLNAKALKTKFIIKWTIDID